MKTLLLLSLFTSCNIIETLTNGDTKISNEFFGRQNGGATGSLYWVEGSIFNSSSIQAEWNYDIDSKFNQIILRVFLGNNCTGTLIENSAPLSTNQTNYTFTSASDTNSYSFQLEFSHSSTGENSFSNCSNDIHIDLTPPGNATSLSYVESSPFNGSTINAQWTKSLSADVDYQHINFYFDSGCSVSLGISQTLNASTQTFPLSSLSDGSSYYYSVETYDLASNVSVSPCSAVMSIDFTSPTPPNSLGWIQGSPHNTLVIDATWTPSSSADVAVQYIQYYSDSTCITPVGGNTALSSTLNTHNFTGVDGNTYTYTIETWDNAGNIDFSSCSSPMTITI